MLAFLTESNIYVLKILLIVSYILLRIPKNEGHKILLHFYGKTLNDGSDSQVEGQALAKGNMSTLKDADMNLNMNSLWFHNPVAQVQLVSTSVDGSRRVPFRKRYSVPKLAKTLSNGLDPFFNMRVFEPFERRPKPITLVPLRKTGLFPRKVVALPQFTSSMESQVAELQSPYNDISSFWKDNPTDS